MDQRSSFEAGYQPVSQSIHDSGQSSMGPDTSSKHDISSSIQSTQSSRQQQLDYQAANASPPLHLSLILVSLAFLVLFLAYNTTQDYVSSLLPHGLGNQSLATLYISVCVFVFTAPTIVARLGEKWTMVGGAACYAVYIGALIKVVDAVVLVASVVIGFGAAILWVALGAYITKISDKRDLGRNNGIFWSIFQLSTLLGNLGGYFIFDNLDGSFGLFTAFTGIAVIGMLVLCFVKHPPKRQPGLHERHADAVESGDGESDGVEETDGSHLSTSAPLPIVEELKLVWHAICSVQMLALSIIIIFSGYELGFWNGSFPKFLHQDKIGIVLTFAGIGEVIGGISMGWISDKLGRTAVHVAGCLIYGCGLGLTSLLKINDEPGPDPLWLETSWAAFVAALCFGLADSAINTTIYSLVGSLSETKGSIQYFTVFQLYQNLGSAGGFYIDIPLPFAGAKGTFAQVWLQIALIVVGASLYAFVDLRQNRIRREAEAKRRGRWSVTNGADDVGVNTPLLGDGTVSVNATSSSHNY